MYYSTADFTNFVLSKREADPYAFHHLGYYDDNAYSKRGLARIHKKAMKAVELRLSGGVDNGPSVFKWYRPWDVVPALRNWQAPEGDFGVGIEIELGFPNLRAAQQVASAVKRWKHITLDFEGGAVPIEATFPPVCYSKFNSRSQAMRYLDVVKDLAIEHESTRFVGTHINVSVGGRAHSGQWGRVDSINRWIEEYGLGYDLMMKYFGRNPVYAGIRSQPTHYECKMFNSVTDKKALRRYVDISVELVKLLESSERINRQSVIDACERGYNLSA